MRVCDRKHYPEIPSIFSYCSGLSDIQTKGGERAKVIEVAPVDLARVEILKTLATIHFAKRVSKRTVGCFGVHIGRFRAS